MKLLQENKGIKIIAAAVIALVIGIIAVAAIHEFSQADSTQAGTVADSSDVSVSTQADSTGVTSDDAAGAAASAGPTTVNTAETTVQSSDSSKFSEDEIGSRALDYFLAQTDDSLSRDSYSVGVSDEVPEEYEDKDYVTVEIRHVNNGNNTLDARYYINESTLDGCDDAGNAVSLN